jgi:tetratricopeptide (TPR) repeat protein
VKNALTSLAIAAIILLLAFLAIWPSPFLEKIESPLAPKPRVRGASPVKTAIEIDPPFGFHWGDSMAHVEALLTYSAAQIVWRAASGDRETWSVEGLIQPGLKSTRFLFEKNALREVELRCQYDDWPFAHYQSRLEELRGYFDAKYRSGQRSQPIVTSIRGNDAENRTGYGWRFQDTNVTVFCRSFTAPFTRVMSVTELVIHYGGHGQNFEREIVSGVERHWSDDVGSPVLAQKLQRKPNEIPADSLFGIEEAKLRNTSQSGRAAFALEVAVSMRPNVSVDPTKTVVQVNFYDSMADREIVQTNAEVDYEWRSHRDWKEMNPETLTVAYKGKLDDQDKSARSRKFFGYVAAVYYEGRLQSVRAAPIKLLNLFAVRTFTSPFEDAQNAAARGDFASAAQLYQHSADQGNLFALENLAWFYAHGKGVQQDYHQAAVFYERAALQNTPRSLNVLAWFLATCPDNTVRNGPEAVRHATKACELAYWQEWKYIDTLAAACAETGDFQRASDYEQMAMELPGAEAEVRQKMEGHLALYQQRQPCRD